MNKQLKILITNGKTQLFYENFQIINSLSMVEVDSALYTVLRDVRGYYIPGSVKRYIEEMITKGESVLYVS